MISVFTGSAPGKRERSRVVDLKGKSKREKVKILNQAIRTIAEDADRAAGTEEVRSFLETMARFHQYSANNVFLIKMQRPDATMVAGFRKWQRHFNRRVRKGSKGIAIFVPYRFKKCINQEKVDGENEEPEYRERVSFGVGYVFDVSDTDGEPLPDVNCDALGPDNGLLKALEAFAGDRGIRVEYRERFRDGRRGESSGGLVRVLSSMEPANKACTLAHELAHEHLHRRHGETLTREQRELEAEATSAVVALNYGIEPRSGKYLAIWSDAKNTGIKVMDRMERIRDAAHWIITGIQKDGGQGGN